MSLVNLLLFATLHSYVYASPLHLQERIVNGDPTSAHLYPWMISLRQEVDFGTNIITNAFCGGTLISSTPPIIITAAHCVDFLHYNWTDMTIRDSSNRINEIYVDINRTYPTDTTLGDHYSSLQISDLSEVIIHKHWNGIITDGYDVALIIFAEHDPLPNIDTPTLSAKLSLTESCCVENEPLTAIGYGKNSTNGVDTFSLHETVLEFISLTTCFTLLVQNMYGNSLNPSQVAAIVAEELETVDESIMCVIGSNTDICEGDSGGPIFRNSNGVPEIVGIASFVLGDCNDGVPSMYTSVAQYNDWILETIDVYVNDTPTFAIDETVGTEGIGNSLCCVFSICISGFIGFLL